MNSTKILHHEDPRFYRAEDFGHGLHNGREIAGWVGYYIDHRPPFGRCYTVEEMTPIRIGATCDVMPALVVQS